jgi:4-aminobutyrate--pyruvate transaminase
MISEPIYQGIAPKAGEIGTFGHGYTYSGHPVCAAVALETLKIYEERGIVDHVKGIAPRLQEGLRRFKDHPLVGEVRGVGLVGAIEVVSDKATKQPFDPKQAIGVQVQNRAQEHGLIIRAMGDSIAFCPPLIITEGEIDDLLARFGRALDETAAALADGGLAKVA